MLIPMNYCYPLTQNFEPKTSPAVDLNLTSIDQYQKRSGRNQRNAGDRK